MIGTIYRKIYRKASWIIMNNSDPAKRGKPVRVMVVDDHEIIHQALAAMFRREADIEFCGSAMKVTDAVPMIPEVRPDLIIVDLSIQHSTDGLLLVEIVKSRYPEIKTLVLSMYDENIYAERAIRAGAGGYIMKEDMRVEVVGAIREIMSGRIYKFG